MRFLRFLPLVAVMFAGACARDAKVTNVARPPLAFIRYINAVPDAGPLDFKFIDAVEYSPSYANSAFRTVGIYQGARAGSRRIRVFRNSSDINVTQIALVDTTLNLVAGTYYTIVHTGYSIPASGTPAQRLVVLEDPRPAVNAGIHVRAVNTVIGAGTANQDVYFCTPSLITVNSGGGQSAAAGAILADSVRVTVTDNCNEPVEGHPVVFTAAAGGAVESGSPATFGASRTIVTSATGRAVTRWRLGTTGAQQLTISASPAPNQVITATITAPPFMDGALRADGVQTHELATAGLVAGAPTIATNLAPAAASPYLAAPAQRFTVRTAATGLLTQLARSWPVEGVAGTVTADPVAGHSQAGSLFTAFIFPRSTAGSAAPQTAAFTVQGITIVADRQPPRTVPD